MLPPPQPANAKTKESAAPNADFFIAAYSTQTPVRNVNLNRTNDQEFLRLASTVHHTYPNPASRSWMIFSSAEPGPGVFFSMPATNDRPCMVSGIS